ncbi:MAG: hypothetical protein P1U39_05675 [Legionellaceae bacterium]|nr:hypothetical protein [Legionellaceae bacterium]
MPSNQPENTPSKIKALENTLAQCQTVFKEPNKLSKQKKADLKTLENEFVSTATELCEQLSDAHEHQTVDDEVTDDIIERAHDIARHVSEKTPIPRKKVEKIIALNHANAQLKTQPPAQNQNTVTQALIELLTKIALLASVVLTVIAPGPGTAIGLSVDIGAALLSFLPHAFDTCKRLFSDRPEPLNLDDAKKLQQAYKQEAQARRENQEPNDEAEPEQDEGPNLV